jgi:RluA family pseudouridine synthase
MNAPPIKLSSLETKEFWEISVLWEDEHLLAVDKPARLLTSPDRYDPMRPNLMKLLHRDIARGAKWAAGRGLNYLMNVHRLDFETSGVILLAKNKPILIRLANLFGTEKPEKHYLALAQGQCREAEFTVEARLAPHPTKPALIRVDEKHGKRAKTICKVLEQFRGFTWLDCQPVTGRTHQIRVHLQQAQLPLVGDETYGGQPLWLSRLKPHFRLKPGATERPLMSRVALHASSLIIPHPVTGETINIQSECPKDLSVALKYLRLFARS